MKYGNLKAYYLTVCFILFCTTTPHTWATEPTKEDLAKELEAVQTQLKKANEALENAELVAKNIIIQAQQEAAEIKSNASSETATRLNIDPILIKNGTVSVELSSATIEEIARAIMPPNWRILVDTKDPKMLQRRFQFVSTNGRDQSLAQLVYPLRLNHQYFFDLLDKDGKQSPLLIISDR